MVLAAALSTGVGAAVGSPVPLVLVGGLVALAVWRRHPALICLLLAVAASGAADRAWDGLVGVEPGPVSGEATLLTDPKDAYGAVRVELRLGRHHLDAWARGAPAATLRKMLAGQRVEVAGEAGPLRGMAAAHLRRHHIAARLELETVGMARDGGPMSRFTNGIRRTLLAGAQSLPESQRGLFGGFVLGDDRDQDAATVDAFRASGLTHLLVVSGQNVAFVMALAAPLVRRGGMGTRLAWSSVILVVFGTLVRWEPSVLRAVAMAGLAVASRTFGRTSSRVRLLALAVIVILLIDPLLVGSVSFQLSVSASVGLAVVTPWLVERVRGPRPLAELIAATVGAQIGVAPVLLAVFGSIPMVALPANLLAVPIAGPVMMWGAVGGWVAGIVGEPLAAVLHWPTRVMLAWVEFVANWGAGYGATPLRAGTFAIAAGIALALAVFRPTRSLAVWGGVAAVLVAIAVYGNPRCDTDSECVLTPQAAGVPQGLGGMPAAQR